MTKRDPLKYFHSSREIIRLAVMMYVPSPLSLHNVEDPAARVRRIKLIQNDDFVSGEG